MGILDNMTAAVNRGTEQAGRAAEKLKLKNQINEINKRRQQLAAQLGASLYDATKNNAELRSGRETLYAGIASCDDERAKCQAKIEELDEMSQAATAAATTYKCAVCGAAMAGDDLFCSGCGSPAEKARPAGGAGAAVAANGPKCASCGAPMSEGDMFCMTCGAKQDSGIGEPEYRENAGVGESEEVKTDSDGNVTITPGGEQ